MKNLIRNRDILNYSENLEEIHKISNFPIFMGTVLHSKDPDIFEDMIWDIGKDTGMIQLKKLIPLNTLYQTNHSSGVIGNLWNLHHEKFAKFISEFAPKKVFEIGGSHGILAKKYEIFDSTVDWTIIDPNPIPSKDTNAKFIKGFFDEKSDFDLKETTVIHSHTLEHVYDPNIFLNSISKNMDNENLQILSVPNINEMIKRKYTNGLNFEHTYFLTEEFLEFFLAKNNFEIIKKEYFFDDHSIFICAKKNKLLKVEQYQNKNFYIKNKNLFKNFIKYYDKLIENLNNKIKNSKSDIFLFGAHIFSQYLLCNGLRDKKIKFILDNDKSKQKKRLYGTNLMVEDPKVLSKFKSPLVILKAGVYTKEIKNQIISNINKDCLFIL